MGFLDHQETLRENNSENNENKLKEVIIKFKDGSGKEITVNKNCVKRMYRDAMSRVLIVVDEVAELTQPGGIKTEEGKREDAMKQEIIAGIQSITQLGRSAGIHCILATQRNDSGVIPGIIQNNPLWTETKILTKND